MKKIFLLTLVLVGKAFSDDVTDVPQLIKCQDGRDAYTVAQKLNDAIFRGEFYGSISPANPTDQPRMIRVKAPFRVSALTYAPQGGPELL